MNRIELLREANTLLHDPARVSDGALLKSLALSGPGPEHARQALAPLGDYVADLDPGALANMPEGSFGRAVHAFCAANHIALLRPQMTARLRELGRERYVAVRYAATHDLVHVLIDEGADQPGELAVYAFACAQGYSRMHWVALAMGTLLWSLIRVWQIPAIVRAIRRGYRKGKVRPLLLASRFEERLAEPLGDVRRDLGLAAVVTPGS